MSELIHLQYVTMVAYLVASIVRFLYFRLFLGFLQGLFLHTFDVKVFCAAGIQRSSSSSIAVAFSIMGCMVG